MNYKFLFHGRVLIHISYTVDMRFQSSAHLLIPSTYKCTQLWCHKGELETVSSLLEFSGQDEWVDGFWYLRNMVSK